MVTTFFGGDFTALADKDPHKTASFRALCERADLQLSAATLSRLVRVGHQARHLPGDLAESLTLTHHRELLAVKNQQHKQRLARLTVLHGWTVQQLAVTIAAEKPVPPRPLGRPHKSPVLKWLEGVCTAAGPAREPLALAEAFAGLDRAAQDAALTQMEGLREKIDGLLAMVGR